MFEAPCTAQGLHQVWHTQHHWYYCHIGCVKKHNIAVTTMCTLKHIDWSRWVLYWISCIIIPYTYCMYFNHVNINKFVHCISLNYNSPYTTPYHSHTRPVDIQPNNFTPTGSFKGGAWGTHTVLRSDAVATISFVVRLVQLLFKGGIYFFGIYTSLAIYIFVK